jgi:hypothetical protein
VDELRLTLPVYSLVTRDAAGPIYVRADADRYVPLFTDQARAWAFLAACGAEPCLIVGMPTPAHLAEFLKNAAGRTQDGYEVDRAVIDPTGLGPGSLTLVPVASLLSPPP